MRIRRKSGRNHGYSRTRLYTTWASIIQRCFDENSTVWNYYGGRGITVCDDWRFSFILFREWAMSNGYREDLTIDRIDTNKDYTPDNCRFITMFNQCMNRRKRTPDKCSSIYKGVSWDSQTSRWCVQIRLKGKRVYRRFFHSETEAALAYNIAIKLFHGEYAVLNVIKE